MPRAGPCAAGRGGAPSASVRAPGLPGENGVPAVRKGRLLSCRELRARSSPPRRPPACAACAACAAGPALAGPGRSGPASSRTGLSRSGHRGLGLHTPAISSVSQLGKGWMGQMERQLIHYSLFPKREGNADGSDAGAELI